MQDDRKTDVGVHIGITMTWEVLARRYSTVILNSTDEGYSHFGDLLRILTEGPDVNNRIFRIVVNVEHGCERYVHPQCSCLHRRYPTHLICELFISGCTNSHQARKVCSTSQINRPRHLNCPSHPETSAGLQVCCNKQRQSRLRLERIKLGRHTKRRSDGHDQATYLHILNEAEDPFVAFRPLWSKIAENPRHQKLSCLFLDRELLERPLSPRSRIEGEDRNLHSCFGLGSTWETILGRCRLISNHLIRIEFGDIEVRVVDVEPALAGDETYLDLAGKQGLLKWMLTLTPRGTAGADRTVSWTVRVNRSSDLDITPIPE